MEAFFSPIGWCIRRQYPVRRSSIPGRHFGFLMWRIAVVHASDSCSDWHSCTWSSSLDCIARGMLLAIRPMIIMIYLVTSRDWWWCLISSDVPVADAHSCHWALTQLHTGEQSLRPHQSCWVDMCHRLSWRREIKHDWVRWRDWCTGLLLASFTWSALPYLYTDWRTYNP